MIGLMLKALKRFILFGDKRLRYLRDQISNELQSSYSDIERLEYQNETLVMDGKRLQSTDLLGKRKFAQKILRVREEVKRQHVLSRVLNAQINILDTQLHNRLLAKKSKLVKLPNIDQLTQTGVEAEDAIISISELNDAAKSCNLDIQFVNNSEDDIMFELGAAIPEQKPVQDKIVPDRVEHSTELKTDKEIPTKSTKNATKETA